VSEDTHLARRVERVPTLPSAADELAKQRTECARLERECQRVKAETELVTEAKGKLEDELREVKELLEARGKEAHLKDASIQWLESDMETKVSQVGSGISSDS